MSAVDIAAALVRRFEGCRLEPYRDPVGLWTVGYGHLLDPDPRAGRPRLPPLSPEAAEGLLERDLVRTAASLLALVRVPLEEGQAGALIDMAFNMGAARLRGSTLMSRLNRREYRDAADEMPRWVYARGVRLPGLVRRRAAERAVFLG